MTQREIASISVGVCLVFAGCSPFKKPPSPAVQSTGAKPVEIAQKAPERKWLKGIVEVQPVRLEKGVSFWRGGRQIQAQEVLLLKVAVENPLDFLPKSMPPPHFLYGRTICEVVQDPIDTGVAVLLAPRPADNEKALLSLVPGIPPEEINDQRTDELLKLQRSRESQTSLAVEAPPGSVKAAAVYTDLSALRQSLSNSPPKQPK